MKSGKIISFCVWLMISFNLLLAFGSVWNFQRMGPEIKQIYQRNVISIEACEKMFVALINEKIDYKKFCSALNDAEGNITEDGERETLLRIRAALPSLEKNDMETKKRITQEVKQLSANNRCAIIKSAEETQKMRQAGSWGIVFTTFFFFVAALFFEQRIRRSLLRPLQEISTVLDAQQMGDKFRRCSDSDASADMKHIFRSINALLDRNKGK